MSNATAESVIARAERWNNGDVRCYDAKENRMPELEGRYEHVRQRVFRHAGEGTRFVHVSWHTGWDCRQETDVPREKW